MCDEAIIPPTICSLWILWLSQSDYWIACHINIWLGTIQHAWLWSSPANRLSMRLYHRRRVHGCRRYVSEKGNSLFLRWIFEANVDAYRRLVGRCSWPQNTNDDRVHSLHDLDDHRNGHGRPLCLSSCGESKQSRNLNGHCSTVSVLSFRWRIDPY